MGEEGRHGSQVQALEEHGGGRAVRNHDESYRRCVDKTV